MGVSDPLLRGCLFLCCVVDGLLIVFMAETNGLSATYCGTLVVSNFFFLEEMMWFHQDVQVSLRIVLGCCREECGRNMKEEIRTSMMITRGWCITFVDSSRVRVRAGKQAVKSRSTRQILQYVVPDMSLLIDDLALLLVALRRDV